MTLDYCVQQLLVNMMSICWLVLTVSLFGMIISIPAAVCMASCVVHCIVIKCQQQPNDFQTMNLPESKQNDDREEKKVSIELHCGVN